MITVASIAALADGVTEMMYFAFAPRSSAVVGTIVELSEKIVSRTIKDARNLALDTVSIETPWVGRAFWGYLISATSQIVVADLPLSNEVSPI